MSLQEEFSLSSDEPFQIKVGKHTVGVLGLKSVMAAMAETFADKPDALIRSELLTQLKKKNYIPDKAKKGAGVEELQIQGRREPGVVEVRLACPHGVLVVAEKGQSVPDEVLQGAPRKPGPQAVLYRTIPGLT